MKKYMESSSAYYIDFTMNETKFCPQETITQYPTPNWESYHVDCDIIFQ